VEKQVLNIMSISVVCLSYAALYPNMWSVWMYHIFPQYLISGKIFGKKKGY